MYSTPKYILTGDQYILVEFGDDISIDIHKRVRGLYVALQQHMGKEIQEVVPTYRSLLVQYNALKISGDEMADRIKELESHLSDMQLPQPRVFRIPVLYGGEHGPDLGYVAEHNRLTMEQVISIHCSRDYLIYMLGFTPGFCYLGGMPEEIATPRLLEPRTCIPAGSVGIAGNQTGIYPIDSPGGWQLIGRTPVKLFDPQNEAQPILFQAGDYIRYYAVSRKEYDEIIQKVAQKAYQVEITMKQERF